MIVSAHASHTHTHTHTHTLPHISRLPTNNDPKSLHVTPFVPWLPMLAMLLTTLLLMEETPGFVWMVRDSDCILQWYSITQLVKWEKNKSKALPNSKIPEGTSTVFKWTAIYWDWAITSSRSGTRGVSAGIYTLLFLLLLLEHQVPPSPPSSQTG